MKHIFTHKSVVIVFLFFAIFLELGCISFLRGYLGPFGSPLILLVAGLFIGISFLYLCKGQSFNVRQQSSMTLNHIFDIVVILLGILFCWVKLNFYIETYPTTIFLEGKGSDVIPQIQIMIQRFFIGKNPYQLITHEEWNFGHRLFPTYLPLTWMPFILAEFVNLDYRMFAFFIFIGSILMLYKAFIYTQPKTYIRLFCVVLPFVFLLTFLEYDITLALVVETMIVGFYLMLVSSFFAKKIGLLAGALILCLLSRYAIVLFFPLILLIIAVKNSWIVSFKVAIRVSLGIMFLYVLPFLSKDPTIYQQGYNYHTKAALAAWERSEREGILSKKSMFAAGLGVAIYFVDLTDQPIAEKMKNYQKLHLILSLFTVLILSLFFLKFSNFYDYRFFILGGLKLYLVVFYNFIQYPFSYLFLVPVFISIPILYFAVDFLSDDTFKLSK